MSDKVKFNCEAKHTKYQPTDEEFNCPKCGAKVGDFFKDDPVGHDECELLHDEDNLCCAQCGYGCSGKAFASRIVKAKSMVKCPTCSGKGMVKKDAMSIEEKLRARVEHYRNLAKSNRDMIGNDDFTPNRGAAEAFEHVIKEIETILDGKG